MSTKPPSPDLPRTLEDVIRRVAATEHLSRQRRQDLGSAVRRFAALHERRPADIPADLTAIRRQIALFTPAAAGMSPRRWKNVRSLLGAALSLTGVTVARRRPARATLSPAWSDLLARLVDGYERARLSRFAGYCAANDIPPDAVCDAVVDDFAVLLRENSLVERPKQAHREVCLTWNRAADTVPDWPACRLTIPNNRRHYALPLSAYPASFEAEVEAWLRHVGGADLFNATGRAPLSPKTLRTNRVLLSGLAGALVHRGRDPASITSLADLVAIDAARTALAFVWERAGRQKTGHLQNLALLLVKLAKHWVKVSDDHLRGLRAMRKQVDPGQSGMTPRNRARLRPFEDPDNVIRLISLPDAIARSLPTGGRPTREQAVLMQSAMAIAVLLVAPMRVKNLAALSMDRHIVRSGHGGTRHIVIPAHEVKNNAPLEFEISSHVGALLDVYVARYRPVLVREAAGFLFPSPSGGAKSPVQLATQIKRALAQQSGLDLNVHAFRHLAAMLYLCRYPGDYETVRLLLGHKNLTTTIRTYCGMEQTDALRRYDKLIDGYRQNGESHHAD